MSVDLEIHPKQKRPAGEPCCQPVAYPDVERRKAEQLAAIAKALGDPIRLQLVDVLRKHAGKVCVCELTPLFDVSQPTVSHHLKVLRDAGVVDSERHGLWAYYYVLPDALDGLAAWIGAPRPPAAAMTRKMSSPESEPTMHDTATPDTPAACPACGTSPADQANEAITHCEWCGAEYPIPDDATQVAEPPTAPEQ